jgi:uncharacterized membrane-anchored protein
MTEKRNANAHQNHRAVEQQQRNRFDNLGLTKRNADYMFRFNRALQATSLDAERKNEIINEMINTLTTDQKRGATARNLYGTVEERIQSIMNPPKEKISMSHHFTSNAVYNAILFFVIFNIMYGVVDLIQKAGTKQSVGIVSLTLMAVAFGICTPFLTRLLDSNVKHTYSGLMRGLFMLLVIVGWMASFFVLIAIPQGGLNVVLPAYGNFILAVIAIVADIYVYHHYTITVNVLAPRPNQNRRS